MWLFETLNVIGLKGSKTEIKSFCGVVTVLANGEKSFLGWIGFTAQHSSQGLALDAIGQTYNQSGQRNM